MPPFDRTRVRALGASAYAIDDEAGRISLHYRLDEAEAFEERIELGAPIEAGERRAALERAVRLLHLVAGVSYYKLANPPRVEVDTGTIDPRTRDLLARLYREGLAEFRVRNDLPLDPGELFAPAGEASANAPPANLADRCLVPIGGGKDSLVTVEALRASGADITLFSVGDAGPIARTAEASGLPRIVVRRHLSPRLLELNADGAYNGHVPVTAIVSLIAVVVALARDFRTVVMSNERSANAGSFTRDGIEVNHQYSKGFEAERLLRDTLRSTVAADLEYFSLLRPASELAIARAFARLPQYHDHFTSCNRVFTLDPDRRASGWCRDCPKCRFVFLALAPFMDADRLTAIFGGNMLADPSQFDGFAALAAHDAHKPFECVGEEQESLAAMQLLADDPRWRDAPVLQRFATEVLPGRDGRGSVPQALALGGEHGVPDRFLPVVDAALGA